LRQSSSPAVKATRMAATRLRVPAPHQEGRDGAGDRDREGDVAQRVMEVVAAPGEGEGSGKGRAQDQPREADVRPSPQAGELRRALLKPAVEEVAGRESEREIDEEGGVGGTAIERHAGEAVEDDLEQRRVAAERVDDRREPDDQEEPELAREEPPAGDAVPEEEQRRHRAGEEIVGGAVGPGPGGHALPVRPPIIIGGAERPEDVAEEDRGETSRRQRSHGRDAEAEGRARRGHEELHG
jgi:hypothetical protein